MEMEFHQRVRHARKAKGLTQQDVADHFGIARVSVTQWEGGTSRPDPDKLADLADLFAVSLDWLLNERGGAPAVVPQRRQANQRTFIKNRAFKFYVAEWREFMGVKLDIAAKAAGMPEDEYGAFETYPINFTLAQIIALSDAIGVRPDQLFWPPPKVAAAISPAQKLSQRSRK